MVIDNMNKVLMVKAKATYAIMYSLMTKTPRRAFSILNNRQDRERERDAG